MEYYIIEERTIGYSGETTLMIPLSAQLIHISYDPGTIQIMLHFKSSSKSPDMIDRKFIIIDRGDKFRMDRETSELQYVGVVAISAAKSEIILPRIHTQLISSGNAFTVDAYYDNPVVDMRNSCIYKYIFEIFDRG